LGALLLRGREGREGKGREGERRRGEGTEGDGRREGKGRREEREMGGRLLFHTFFSPAHSAAAPPMYK